MNTEIVPERLLSCEDFENGDEMNSRPNTAGKIMNNSFLGPGQRKNGARPFRLH